MKLPPARSLIQVHYHDRFGGVNRVIGCYARAFTAMHKKTPHGNRIICAGGPSPETAFLSAEVVSVTQCDYREFSSKIDFLKVKYLLVELIERQINDPALPRPLCVMGHNLTLGKNCALSAAFAQCAKNHARKDAGILFFSVIHDFAEEGRADCMERINKTRKRGIDIWRQLYPISKNVRYCTPNRRNAVLLKKTGFNSQFLVNPVEGLVRNDVMNPRKTPELKKRLLLFAKLYGSAYDKAMPTILYPCRCIARKNILEAILLVTILHKANLLIGAPGNSPGDKAFYGNVETLCKHYRLPVILDCGRIFSNTDNDEGFPKELYLFADACVSTSIAEGFGYAMYEPWLFGKAVFGRRPSGFSAVGGVKFEDLYDGFPVPAAWVSLPALSAKYYASMRTCFGHVKGAARFFSKDRFNGEFSAHCIKNGALDFGCLDATTQFAVVRMVLNDPDKIEEWKKVCEKEYSALQMLFEKSIRSDTTMVNINRGRIQKKLSMRAFSKAFAQCLGAQLPALKPRNDFRLIAREFCSFPKFRLLMTSDHHRI